MMFFLLSKLAYFLLMPAVLISLSALMAFLLRNTVWKRRFIVLSVGLFLLCTNVFLINELYLWWEEAPSSITQNTPDYDVAIVFTGMTNAFKSPKDRVHFDKGADRLMQAIHLYKLGKVKKILVSGGSGKVLNDGFEEATILKSVLLECAVAPQDIIIENKAMNTYENAVYTSALIKKDFNDGKVLLITSAFHMRRSKACLLKQGIEFDTYSVDFYSFDRSFTPDVLIIPSEYAFYKSQKLIHEVLGFLVYKLMGYA